MRFSANTGFLYKDLPFLDRIRAAAAAGFDAVEFHDEAQGADPAALAAALAETGLPVCGLNVRMGETSGCAAIPGAEAQARADIDAAVRRRRGDGRRRDPRPLGQGRGRGGARLPRRQPAPRARALRAAPS